jgi:hypothetical protein
VDLPPDEAVGAQIDVPRRKPAVDEGRHRGERERRLGDEVLGVGLDPLGIGVDLLLAVEAGPTSIP